MKAWYQSKTLWFNIITVAVGVIGELTKTINMTSQTAQIFATILAVGNFLLRFITNTGIGATPTK